MGNVVSVHVCACARVAVRPCVRDFVLHQSTRFSASSTFFFTPLSSGFPEGEGRGVGALVRALLSL